MPKPTAKDWLAVLDVRNAEGAAVQEPGEGAHSLKIRKGFCLIGKPEQVVKNLTAAYPKATFSWEPKA